MAGPITKLVGTTVFLLGLIWRFLTPERVIQYDTFVILYGHDDNPNGTS